ncbi:hypothetical protein CLV58_11456 [Spirosoma oryzae]|uniref:Lipoprotein n=1 Tax=Spirosoma oryzae TaxID=1469603 RepID=A0A2T0SPX5_9BACT|nr:hypothetical protein [Spirosoma oryzae]PRY35471.1 hypothetical protein CLV58_11456 [Spirosoma oryzae]
MKRQSLIVAVLLGGSLLGGCHSGDKLTAEDNLSLVSPTGVRIANSLKDLEKADVLTNKHDGKITITKITYGWEPNGPLEDKAWAEKNGSTITRANVHYRTSKGADGIYWIEIVSQKPKSI